MKPSYTDALDNRIVFFCLQKNNKNSKKTPLKMKKKIYLLFRNIIKISILNITFENMGLWFH